MRRCAMVGAEIPRAPSSFFTGPATRNGELLYPRDDGKVELIAPIGDSAHGDAS